MEKPGSLKYDIRVRTRLFSSEIIRLCHQIKKAGVEYYLYDQLGRSGTSVGANLHEGKYSSSKREYCRYYQIALRSGYETLYWLDVISDNYQFEGIAELKQEINEIIKIISSIILNTKSKLKKARIKQNGFKERV